MENLSQNQIVNTTQDLPILYPKELMRLVNMRKTFEQEGEAIRARHEHLWSSAVISPSVATRNHRKTEVCFQCGQVGKFWDYVKY